MFAKSCTESFHSNFSTQVEAFKIEFHKKCCVALSKSSYLLEAQSNSYSRITKSLIETNFGKGQSFKASQCSVRLLKFHDK